MLPASKTLAVLLLGTSLLASTPLAYAQGRAAGGHGGGSGAAHAGTAHAGAGHAGGGTGARASGPMRPSEPERPPVGYSRVERPQGADARPQQLDRQAYNHNFRATQPYHIGPYHAPRGYAYRRWAYGEVLPSLYWGRDYWVLDYWLFGLDVPPYGYEWVRYGPDALLIDLRSGEVIQVVYGRFL